MTSILKGVTILIVPLLAEKLHNATICYYLDKSANRTQSGYGIVSTNYLVKKYNDHDICFTIVHFKAFLLVQSDIVAHQAWM